MASPMELVLRAFAVAIRPLVRLLVRKGVTYPAAAERLRAAFIGEAMAEIQAKGMKPTASAVSLLSGVHRKDLRARDLDATQGDESGPEDDTPLGLIGEVVARWLSDPDYCEDGRPRRLQRGAGGHDFDRLVQGVSTDVGPRAVLDEMLRLQVARSSDEGIELDTHGMVPRGDFAAMASALGDNLRDHAASASANLLDGRNQLEQALYVDEITPESAQRLHREAAKAWQTAFARVMRTAEQRHAHDQQHAEPGDRRSRVRFGVYFHEADDSAEQS